MLNKTYIIILMQNYYSSSRSTAEYNKYPTSNNKYDTGYKYIYPEYTHSRRKTDYDLKDYDNNEYLLQRSTIYQQLQEQKLYNQRSRLIIEDLLEENKRKKNLIDEIVINKMNPKQTSKNSLLQDRKYLEDRAIRAPPETERKSSPSKNNKTLQSYSRDNDKNRYQPVYVKNKQIPPTNDSKGSNQKDMTKSIILKKLYEQPKKNSPNKKKQNQKQQKINETEILRDQVQFLKQQLSQKNRDIIQLQCEIVRLSKLQKLQAEAAKQNKNKSNRYHTIQSSAKQQIQQQSESAQSKYKLKQKKLSYSNRCCQIVVKAKRKQKKIFKNSNSINISIQKQQVTKPNFLFSQSCSLNFSIEKSVPKLLEICNHTFLTVQKSMRIQKFTNTHAQLKNEWTQTKQDKRFSQAQIQTELEQIYQKIPSTLNVNSKINVQVSSSGVLSSQWGGQIDQNQFNLSDCKPQQKVSRQSLQIPIKEYESFILSRNSENIMKQDAQVQTEYECINQQAQTTQNYYEFIQKTYLQWMFDKQYKQMEVKKSKKKIQSDILP